MGWKFYLDTTILLFKRKNEYNRLADPKPNVKNARYQMFIGKNTMKTIGCAIVDAGLLPEVKVAQVL